MYEHALKLTEPAEDEWIAGQGKATARFGGDLNPTADWTRHYPPVEDQRRYGFETMACTVFHTTRAWLALARFQGFQDFPQDIAERYSAIATGVEPDGHNPQIVAELTRRDYGMVDQKVLPWTPDRDTWDEFYSPKKGSPDFKVFEAIGKELRDRFELGHEWVFPPGSSLSPEEKNARLMEYLKRGPVCVSVDAWKMKGGSYSKPKGGPDNHWTSLIRYDRGHPIILDTYDPYTKRLAKDYDFGCAKVFFLKRKEPGAESFWSRLYENFRKLWSLAS